MEPVVLAVKSGMATAVNALQPLLTLHTRLKQVNAVQRVRNATVEQTRNGMLLLANVIVTQANFLARFTKTQIIPLANVLTNHALHLKL